MSITIIEATEDNVKEIVNLVTSLLIELEPESKKEINDMGLEAIAYKLVDAKHIFVFLAKIGRNSIGVITLHQCAAIYAGGIFGEISEMYVKPAFRSENVGKLLIAAAMNKARALKWKRLEVCTPKIDTSRKTIQFYEKNNFIATGTRLRLLID